MSISNLLETSNKYQNNSTVSFWTLTLFSWEIFRCSVGSHWYIVLIFYSFRAILKTKVKGDIFWISGEILSTSSSK